MNVKHFFILVGLLTALALSNNNVIARSTIQKPKAPISSDSLATLNKYALSLVYTNPDSALFYANEAYRISFGQNDSLEIANSLTSIAAVYWAEAKYNLSLKLYFNALANYEQLEDTTGILRCYNNIGEVYKKLKSYSNTKRYLQKVQDLYPAYFPNKTPVLNYINFAELFLEQKNYDSAAYYLNKAKLAPDKELSINHYATINYNYAILSKDTANYNLANTFIEQSIHFAQIAKNDRKLSEAYNIKGEILIAENIHSQAVEYFEKALALSIQLKHEHLELRIHKNLYLLNFEKGNTINAITHILRYTELKDRIYTSSISRQSAEFETVYELEKIEEQNTVLQLKQAANDSIIKYQIGFIVLALIALVIAVYFVLAINKQRRYLKQALSQLEDKSKVVEKQKLKIEKQSRNTNALNHELTLLNKNLESRAHEIAREIDVKNKKMNKYAFMNAHKLRAPIASIIGLINLFGKNITPEDEATMISMLKESAHNLDNVVHEIKDVIDE